MGAPAGRTTRSAYGRAPGCIAVLAVAFFMLAMLSAAAKGSGSAIVMTLLMLLAIAIGIARHQQQNQRATELHRIRSLQSTEITRYHAMGPQEFEQAVAFLCERDGCRDVRVVGGSGDLGADVIATAPDGRRIVIQCKRYGPTTKVGSPDLQRFGGTCYSVHGAQVAAVVTTSEFTKPAAGYSMHHGIRLFDSTALAGWATRTGPAPWM